MNASTTALGAWIRPRPRTVVRAMPWWRIPAYPAAFLSLYIVLLWADSGIPLGMLWRPMAVAIIASGLLTLLASAITGDRDRGALIATCLLLTLLTSSDPLALILLFVAIG